MGSKMEFNHVPVLKDEVISGLNIQKGKTYIDCTIGGAGHASEMLKCENIFLVGFDQDQDAIDASKERLKEYGDHVTIVKSNFKDAPDFIDKHNIKNIYGVLVDLGVSSHQIDTSERGFSFRFDSVLDMRMDKEASLSAKELVNTYSEQELARVIKEYGEEKFAKSIARKIVGERKKAEILTTKQLEKIILSAVPRYRGNDGSSNVQRTFQAIRIEVNHELDGLDTFIKSMVDRLESGGRMAIISFHSLEDRIVKHTFKELAEGCTCPKDFPVCVCGKKPIVKIITPHPITASETEAKQNRRSQSAKLRIVEKL